MERNENEWKEKELGLWKTKQSWGQNIKDISVQINIGPKLH